MTLQYLTGSYGFLENKLFVGPECSMNPVRMKSIPVIPNATNPSFSTSESCFRFLEMCQNRWMFMENVLNEVKVKPSLIILVEIFMRTKSVKLSFSLSAFNAKSTTIMANVHDEHLSNIFRLSATVALDVSFRNEFRYRSLRSLVKFSNIPLYSNICPLAISFLPRFRLHTLCWRKLIESRVCQSSDSEVYELVSNFVGF